MQEGQLVSYVGLDESSAGSVGQVLEADHNSAHVLWKSGSLSGQIGLHPVEDLGSTSPAGLLADSLDYGYSSGMGVSASLNDSLDYEESRDLASEAIKEAGEAAFRAAVASLDSSPFMHQKLSYSDDTKTMAVSAFAKKAMRKYIADSEEE